MMFFLKAFFLCFGMFSSFTTTPMECTSMKMLIFLTHVLLVLEVSKQTFGQKKHPSSDVIWFPIDGFEAGIQSTLGEIFLTRSRPRWRRGRSTREIWYEERNTGQAEQSTSGSHHNFVVRGKGSRRGFMEHFASKKRNDEYANLVKHFGRTNSGNRHEEMHLWDHLWPSPPPDAIVFPGPNNANEKELDHVQQDVSRDCERSCPVTRQFDPICGSDGVNYNNLGALKCAQYCGTRVTLSHYGVCGSGLPSIFKPRPRRPKSTTPVPARRIAWNNW